MALQLPWVPSGGTPCCCEECCLYPIPEFPVTSYTFDDLPDELMYTDSDGTVPVHKVENGGDWEYLTATDELRIKINSDGNGWAYGDDGGAGSGPCLIMDFLPTGGKAEDEFPNSLSVDISELGVTGMIVDRFDVGGNPCDWYGCMYYEHVGSEDHFIVVKIHYNNGTYKWDVTVEIWNGQDCGSLLNVISTSTQTKEDPQNTPVGTYLGTYTVTVS